MRIERKTGWAGMRAWEIPKAQCPYAGIAIGPSSQVARVLVNGELLQAGRVLALREPKYTITHVVPAAAPSFATTSDVLELMLFEDAHELGAEVSRPNGQFSAVVTPIDGVGETQVLRIPFEGRRQIRINITAGGVVVLDYRIVGRYWSAASGTLKEVEIDSGTDVTTLSRMYGGTNEAEAWTEIGVYVTVDADAGVIAATVDAEPIGEIGCR